MPKKWLYTWFIPFMLVTVLAACGNTDDQAPGGEDNPPVEEENNRDRGDNMPENQRNIVPENERHAPDHEDNMRNRDEGGKGIDRDINQSPDNDRRDQNDTTGDNVREDRQGSPHGPPY